MSWRFFWVVSALMVAFVSNAWLLYLEDVKVVVDVDLDERRIEDELAGRDYAPSTRLQNFKEYGLPEELAKAAANQSAELMKARGPELKMMLNRDIDNVVGPLCAGGVLPQRYAALEVLVIEENLDRVPVSGKQVFAFEPQPWFGESYTEQVYNHMEMVEERRRDSTALGLAAILAAEERALLDDKAPWKEGLTGGSIDKVLKKHRGLDNKLVRYVSLMHVLTELANSTTDPICAGPE